MKKCRLGIAAGLMVALAITSAVQAQQYNFAPIAGPTPALTTTWSGGYNLGTSTAGNYTSYFVAIDWLGSTALANQWSNEARASLHSGVLGATPGTLTTGPAGSSTIHLAKTVSATGSAGNINPVNNIRWNGNFGTSFVSTGANNLYFSHRQSFNATPTSATWGNMRVVLNPNIISSTVLGAGLAAPGTFTNLGALTVNQTSLDLAANNTNTGAAGINWYRFTVDKNVDPSNAFDMYTSGALDTRLTLFHNTGSGLFAVESNDDTIGLNAALTFGSSDPTAHQRDYGTGSALFNGRGGNLAIANLAGLGYFANTAGAATLSDTNEYFLALSHFSGTAPSATLTTTGFAINPTNVTISSSVNMAMGNPTTALGTGVVSLHFRSLPEPGSAVMLGSLLVTGMIFRRRR
jgi:hypothetical protein